jgi:hypothetical protein
MFEVNGFLTNSVEKGFSQPWEPLLVVLANKRRQRQGFERTSFFFSFFSSSHLGSGAQNGNFLYFFGEIIKEPILNGE